MRIAMRLSSRYLALGGLLIVGAILSLGEGAQSDATLVANKWKVRPAPQRNYRRFYSGYQGYGYGYGYGYGMPEMNMPSVPMEEVPATGDLPTGSRQNNNLPRRLTH